MRRTDAEWKALKERVLPLLDRWLTVLGLGDWETRVDWFDGDVPGHPDAVMVVDPDWRYEHSLIRVSMSRVEELDLTRLEEVIVHELCHIMVNELRAAAGDTWTTAVLVHEERVATRLARAMVRLRDDAMREAHDRRTKRQKRSALVDDGPLVEDS